MGVKIHKPILLTGFGLSVGVWIWSSFGNSLLEMGQLSLNGAIALGGFLWLLQRQRRQDTSLNSFPASLPTTIEASEVEAAITTTSTMLSDLSTLAPEVDTSDLQKQITQLPELLNSQTVTIAITGNQKVGKTTLKNLLENKSIENRIYTETELNTASIIVFLTTGDLTESEWQELQNWCKEKYTIIIALNKQDQYRESEQILIIEQIKQKVKQLIPQENIVAIAAKPKPVKVRQYQSDGSVKEWQEECEPEIQAVETQINKIISQQQEKLLLATTWRRAIALQQQINQITNELKAKRALPIIERYQWLAATAALANPIPAVDLLATVAINGQMLVDIGEIYQQKFSLNQAKTAAATLGELIVKLGLVEISTQTIAGLLKSNSITYIAGGGIQGASAAYLTRVAGLSLIEYFESQPITLEGWNLEKLTATIQKVFAENKISYQRELLKYLQPWGETEKRAELN